MEDVMVFRDKHLTVNVEEVNALLQKKLQRGKSLKNEQNQHSNETENKVEELLMKVVAMTKNLALETQAVEQKEQELCKHLETVNELKGEKLKFLEEIRTLELKSHKLKVSKPSSSDKKILEHGKKRFELYKEFTRIRWDFEVLKEATRGYITNKYNYIHHFSYKPDEKDLSELLWKEIKQSTIQECEMENCIQNTDKE